MGIDKTSRAQGRLLGQLAGDVLGSLVEFQSPDEIRRRYPDGVRILIKTGSDNSEATVNKYMTVRQEGNRESKRSLDYCYLDIIIPASGSRSSLSRPGRTKAGGLAND